MQGLKTSCQIAKEDEAYSTLSSPHQRIFQFDMGCRENK